MCFDIVFACKSFVSLQKEALFKIFLIWGARRLDCPYPNWIKKIYAIRITYSWYYSWYYISCRTRSFSKCQYCLFVVIPIFDHLQIVQCFARFSNCSYGVHRFHKEISCFSLYFTLACKHSEPSMQTKMLEISKYCTAIRICVSLARCESNAECVMTQSGVHQDRCRRRLASRRIRSQSQYPAETSSCQVWRRALIKTGPSSTDARPVHLPRAAIRK